MYTIDNDMHDRIREEVRSQLRAAQASRTDGKWGFSCEYGMANIYHDSVVHMLKGNDVLQFHAYKHRMYYTVNGVLAYRLRRVGTNEIISEGDCVFGPNQQTYELHDSREPASQFDDGDVFMRLRDESPASLSRRPRDYGLEFTMVFL